MFLFLILSENSNEEIPGCPSAVVKKDMAYVFFLNEKTRDYYEIEFQPIGGEASIIIDDLTIICGLTLQFPKGTYTIQKMHSQIHPENVKICAQGVKNVKTCAHRSIQKL